MVLFLQAITAFFAVIGLFEVLWQCLLFFTCRALRGPRARILVETDEKTNPAFLMEDLHLLSGRLTACKNLRIWLLCPKGAPQEEICRYVAEHNESVRVFAPEELSEEVHLFLQDL